MPLFSRLKSIGGSSARKGANGNAHGDSHNLQKPRWQSTWASESLELDEVEELIHICTAEMKTRAEALDAPFLLLPFRPHADTNNTPTFIRNFYTANAQGSPQYKGANLQQELRLTESIVLCSIMKWCWSRMPGGVVTWSAFEGFKIGERESKFDRNAFHTFIPLSVDSTARKSIIFDFFDLLAAVAAHGKNNGLGGRKLSRLAGWWAFEHSDDGKGFEGGYKSWTAAADACSHLFFAYLRSLSPEADPSISLIERIPRSLQALLASTEYPPETPSLLQRTTPRVVMVVDHVSPTPFALLRRAKHFEYRDQDKVLREYSEFEDPIDALTEECKRVLLAISSANSKHPVSSHGNIVAMPEESWSAFENSGFHEIDETLAEPVPAPFVKPVSPVPSALTGDALSRVTDLGRPTTPSWADFMSSGFADDGTKQAQPTLMLPPDKQLPLIANRALTPSRSIMGDESLRPGELAAITSVELDDAFWWVWMTSLANEEPPTRKAVFGRCALVESTIMNGKWLIMEELVKGASPDVIEDAYIAPKKSLFASLTKRGRLARKASSNKKGLAATGHTLDRSNPGFASKTSLAPDQHSRIKAAAAALATKPTYEKADELDAKRSRVDDATAAKNSSAITAGVMSEATPAMKWANAYDKDAIRAQDKSALRAQYLGDTFAGKGISRESLTQVTTATPQQPVVFNKKEEPAPLQAELPASQPEPETSFQELGPSAECKPVDPAVKAAQAAAQVAAVDIPTRVSSAEQNAQLIEKKPVSSDSSSKSKTSSVSQIKSRLEGESANAKISRKTSVGRKPVASPKHPALRQSTFDEDYEAAPAPVVARKASSPQIARGAAALAAANAMKNRDEPEFPNAYKKQSSTGGFKKMFGSRREVERTNSRGGADAGIASRPFQLRKKSATTADDISYQIAAARKVSGPASEDQPRPYTDSSYEADPHEEATARREFSRFDQGPLDSMPAASPRTPIEDEHREIRTSYSHEKEVSHEFESKGIIEPGHFEQEDRATPSKPINDATSDSINETPQTSRTESDRWETVQEDTAGQTAARASEEQSYQSHRSRFSQSGRTDDGETSGEETIESRVARIKARVAELTGGLDQGSSAGRR